MNKKFNVTIIGAGGIGGFLAEILVRSFTEVSYSIMDKDIVELKNLFRQPFSITDVGRSKAGCITSKLINLFGSENLAIVPLDSWFTAATGVESVNLFLGYANVIISCVDNNAARLAIFNLVDANPDLNIIAIVAANGTDSSNVYFYSHKLKDTPYDPRQRFASLFDEDTDNPLSCTSVQVLSNYPQTTLANFNAAADAATMFRMFYQNWEFIRSCKDVSKWMPYEFSVGSSGKDTVYFDKHYDI